MTRFQLPLACLATLSLLGVAGCAGDGERPRPEPRAPQTASCSRPPDQALTAAVRAHPGDFELATTTTEGGADRLEAAACPTSAGAGEGVVTVYGLRDDSVRDARHELTLVRRGGRWAVTGDVHTQRCRAGRGHQEFTPEPCV